MTVPERSHGSQMFRRVWRALDTLCDAATPETAYQLAFQVIYLRCRPAPFGGSLERYYGPSEPALRKTWASLGLDHRFHLMSRETASTRRLFGEADDRALAALISEVNRLEESVGLFDACLDRYSSRFGEDGDYYTPRTLARLMAGLAAPRPGERVLDPACGCGRLLTAAAHWARGQDHGAEELRIHGRDIRSEARRVAAMNLTLNELHPDLGDRAVDSLRVRPASLSADVILSNPPLNMKDWGHQELSEDPRWSLGLPPRGNANFAWVQHILYELSSQGRAVVLLPDSATRSSNFTEAGIRRQLVDTDLLAGVVALPAGLFPHTRTGTTLWLLSKDKNPHVGWGRNARTGEVLFADARRLDTHTDRSGRHLTDSDIDRICRIFAVWRGICPAQDDDVPEGVSWCSLRSRYEIAQRGYDLSPGIYIRMPYANIEPAPSEDEDRQPKDVLYAHFEEAARINGRLRRVLQAQPTVEHPTETLFELTEKGKRLSRPIKSELGTCKTE